MAMARSASVVAVLLVVASSCTGADPADPEQRDAILSPCPNPDDRDYRPLPDTLGAQGRWVRINVADLLNGPTSSGPFNTTALNDVRIADAVLVADHGPAGDEPILVPHYDLLQRAGEIGGDALVHLRLSDGQAFLQQLILIDGDDIRWVGRCTTERYALPVRAFADSAFPGSPHIDVLIELVVSDEAKAQLSAFRAEGPPDI